MEKPVSIISGASRGIGREIARRLAREGHFVILMARNQEELEELEVEIDLAGGKSLSVPADLSDPGVTAEAVQMVARDFGRIDAVVCNAGVGEFAPVVALEPESWQRMMAVNAEASFLLARYALPYMKARGSGHFVAICSDAARRAFANGAAYIASKAAQDWFFQALRRETRPFGIKVSVVFPGLTDTWFNGGTPGAAERSEDLKPTDIADAVAYILNAPQHVVIDEIMLHPANQEW